MTLRVISAAVLYSVFGNNQKENGMPAKVMVSRPDHTPDELRELASTQVPGLPSPAAAIALVI